MNKKKVIELIRVSTEAQAAEDRAGIPAQRAVNRRTCHAFGLEIVRTFEMSDVSGASVLLAPEIQQLMLAIQSPDIHGVVTKEFSRLMRPERFSDYALLQAFVDTKTVLYLPEGPLDLASKTGRLMGTIRAAIAGLERSEILERVWLAKEEKRRAGQCPQSAITLPFGVGYKDGQWFYKDEAEKVREAFRMFLAGESSYIKLAEMVGVTPRGMSLILRNPIYTGWKVYDKRRDMSAKGKYEQESGRQSDRRKLTRPAEEIIRVKVIAEPIISEQDFARVQSVMDRKALRHWRADRNYQHRFTYNGFLTCSLCGTILHTGFMRDDYYVCKGRKEKRCDAKYMRRDVLEKELDTLFAVRLTNKTFLNDLYRQWEQNSKASDSGRKVQRLRTEIDSLQAKRARVLESFFDGVIGKEDRDRRVSAIDKSIRTNQAILLRENPATATTPKDLAKLLRVFVGWRRLTRDQKRTVLASVTPEIHVANYAVTGLSLMGLSFSNKDTRTDTGTVVATLYFPMTYNERESIQ